MNARDFLSSVIGLIALFILLMAWLIAPFAITFMLVFIYTQSGVAAAISAVFMEIVAIIGGLLVLDVVN